MEYVVTVTVTGANFDAITYRGVLAIEEEDEPMTPSGRLKTLNWKEPLKRL
jgi:hypothetical protein